MQHSGQNWIVEYVAPGSSTLNLEGSFRSLFEAHLAQDRVIARDRRCLVIVRRDPCIKTV